MEIVGINYDYILLIDEYFKKFHEHLEQLSVSNEKSVDAFLDRHNLKVVEASIELIQGKVEPTTLQLLKLGEQVISHSLREGFFDVKKFNKSIEENQEEFAKVIKFLRRKDSSCDEAIKLLEEFIRNNYRAATFAEIQKWFVHPLSFDIRQLAKGIQQNDNLSFMGEYRQQKELEL